MNDQDSGAERLLIAATHRQSVLETLQKQGVALPSECGGQGTCGQCRVQVIQGNFNPLTSSEGRLLSGKELGEGLRLACRLRGSGEIRFERNDIKARPLNFAAPIESSSRSRFGVAIDLGTTTLRLSLLDISAQSRLGAAQVPNAQAALGADVMTRLAYAMYSQDHHARLTRMIREQLHEQIIALASASAVKPEQIAHVVIVGNTAMTHLLLGVNVETLALVPYRSPLEDQGCINQSASQWGWELAPNAICTTMPIVHSFVGSDLLADLVEVEITRNKSWTLVLDLGTNGEVALGNRERIYCASTAAGCAFEATSLRCGVGMRPGAVWRLWEEAGAIRYETLDGKPPTGLCGSGALSAVALLRQLSVLDSSGRMFNNIEPNSSGNCGLTLLRRADWALEFTQDDVRQIQLAKGAIAAASQILLERADLQPSELDRVVLIGNFGGNLDIEAAIELGLLPCISPSKVEVLQEATLQGAEQALYSPETRDEFAQLSKMIEWVSLVECQDFAERFALGMAFAPQEPYVCAG